MDAGWSYNKFGQLRKLHQLEGFVDDKSAKIYTLCVIASFKNNMYRLKEWINHHLWQGVEHFYLIDEGSVDDYWTEIQSFVTKGIVTIDVVSETNEPYDARDYAFKRYKDVSEWFAVIDTNTFLFTTMIERYNLRDFINKVEEDVAGIYVHGRLFSNENIANDSSPCIRKTSTWRSVRPMDIPQGIVRASLTFSLRQNMHEHKHGKISVVDEILSNVYVKKSQEEVQDRFLSEYLEKKNPNQCW